MKLKQILVIVLALSVFGSALAVTLGSRSEFVARKHPKKEAIKKKQNKARRIRRKHQTMFANKAFNSLRANQILLTTKKVKITVQ
jgi:hypothetical protein